MPFIPLSDEPMASTMMMSGSSSSIWSLTDGLKTTALEDTTNSEDRSQRSGFSARVSTSGRAMASPVITIVVTRLASMASNTASALKLRTNTTVLPSKRNRSEPHWAAPCISGGVFSATIGASDALALSASSWPWVTRSLV